MSKSSERDDVERPARRPGEDVARRRPHRSPGERSATATSAPASGEPRRRDGQRLETRHCSADPRSLARHAMRRAARERLRRPSRSARRRGCARRRRRPCSPAIARLFRIVEAGAAQRLPSAPGSAAPAPPRRAPTRRPSSESRRAPRSHCALSARATRSRPFGRAPQRPKTRRTLLCGSAIRGRSGRPESPKRTPIRIGDARGS